MATFLTTDCNLALPLIHQIMGTCVQGDYLHPYAQVMLDASRTKETERTLIICDSRMKDRLSEHFSLSPFLPRRSYEKEIGEDGQVSLELTIPKMFPLSMVQSHLLHVAAYFKACFGVEPVLSYPDASRRLDLHNGLCLWTTKLLDAAGDGADGADETTISIKDDLADLMKAFLDHHIWPGMPITAPLSEVYFQTRWIYPAKTGKVAPPLVGEEDPLVVGTGEAKEAKEKQQEPVKEKVKTAPPKTPQLKTAEQPRAKQSAPSKPKSNWAQMVVKGMAEAPEDKGSVKNEEEMDDEETYSLRPSHRVVMADIQDS